MKGTIKMIEINLNELARKRYARRLTKTAPLPVSIQCGAYRFPINPKTDDLGDIIAESTVCENLTVKLGDFGKGYYHPVALSLTDARKAPRHLPLAAYHNHYRVSRSGEVSRWYETLKVWHPLKNRTGNTGYVTCGLSLHAKERLEYVHRLVALSYIPNLYNLPQVNHIDENPLNNHLVNLELCAPVYNLHFGKRSAKAGRATSKGFKRHHHAIVAQFDRTGRLIATYLTRSQAAKGTGTSVWSIMRALKGLQKSAGGYTWREIPYDSPKEA